MKTTSPDRKNDVIVFWIYFSPGFPTQLRNDMKSAGSKERHLRPSARPGKDQGCRGRALFSAEAGAEASGLGGIIPRYNTSISVYPFRNRCLYIYADLCLHLYLCSCQYIFFLFPATWRIASIWANPSRGRSGSLQFTSNPSGTFHFSLLKSCSKLFISVYLSLPSALQISKFRRGRARKPPAEEELSFSITAFIHAPFLLLCQ